MISEQCPVCHKEKINKDGYSCSCVSKQHVTELKKERNDALAQKLREWAPRVKCEQKK